MGSTDQQGIGLDDVAELRSLLRRRDVVARQVGLAMLRSWSAADLDGVGARAVLEAAGGAYPALPGQPDEPAELLVRLLWDVPALVPVPDVLRVQLVACEAARRALVHLLALRGGDEGIAALESLTRDTPSAQPMPVPTTPVLDPLLSHPDADRVARLLVELLGRRGWTWHAADLLVRLLRETPAPGEPAVVAAREGAVAVAHGLCDACDGAAAVPADGGDPARTERESLRCVLRLLDVLDRDATDASDASGTAGDVAELRLRLLGSADPQVAAMAAARMVATGAPVAPERLTLIARDPLARVELADTGAALGVAAPVPLDDVELHQGRLAAWLSSVTEMGRVPDEMEHVATVEDPSVDRRHPASAGAAPGRVHVYRFRVRAPHWSAARGWMIGVSGAFTLSDYRAEDECTVREHVAGLRATLSNWPEWPADGAA